MSVFIWSSQSDERYDDYMATWLYTKKWKPPETTICKRGLTQVSFYTWHNKAICTLKLLGDSHAQGAVKQVSAGVATV